MYREALYINWIYIFKILMDDVEDYPRKYMKREQKDILKFSVSVRKGCEVFNCETFESFK